MRMNSAPVLKHLGLSAAAFVTFICAPAASAQNNSHSQVMILPDPTPRQTDPRLLYQHDDPNPLATTQRGLAVQNEKRRQLIIWAANELVVLSDRAEKAAAAAPSSASKTELTVNVNKIETLSKNLANALKAQ